jgi:hypothetical protein
VSQLVIADRQVKSDELLRDEVRSTLNNPKNLECSIRNSPCLRSPVASDELFPCRRTTIQASTNTCPETFRASGLARNATTSATLSRST